MTTANAVPPLSSEDFERILLGRLGLPANASSEDIEAAHYAVTHYLAKAPRELKDWARRQAAEVDEAYAILIDPTALADPAALVGQATRSVAVPGGPATPPARRDSRPASVAAASTAATATAHAVASGENGAAKTPEEATFEEMLAAVTPTAHRETVPDRHSGPAHPVPVDRSAEATSSGGGWLRRLGFVAAGAALAIAVMAVGNGLVGGTSAEPSATASPQPSAAASQAPALDTDAVAALMQKLQADPKDTTTLMSLADEYYKAEQWATAKEWLDKLLTIDAQHVKGLLASGAVAFNTRDLPGAESAWKKVVEVDPDNLEAHYDLGFLYLQKSPPDMDGMRREWTRVVEIAPDSDVAQTVKAHLEALASSAPSAAPSPGSSPAPSVVPSAAPSAAPSGSTNP